MVAVAIITFENVASNIYAKFNDLRIQWTDSKGTKNVYFIYNEMKATKFNKTKKKKHRHMTSFNYWKYKNFDAYCTSQQRYQVWVFFSF